MRRKDKEILDSEVLHSVINQATVCRIGLVKEDRPYVIPLSFGFDGSNIYFHSARSGEKVEILKVNNHVCLEFEQDISIIEGEKPCDWSARYLTVVVHGRAELVEEFVDKKYGLGQIAEHYQVSGEQYPFTAEEIRPVLVYKVTIEEIVGKISG
ncbi:putative flavin-nucleotide-binding protein [Desulfitobacterium dichloroeliminans LMG P-21439]|uniref:Putative flavin-nucleotide-binding protein n=1 Tax=Desulfitobacterium dichloroeliminans (strain LMG P-21439 / DCA1) TaxID=871963 RepID=L0F508_DESDL|nr:pyridoxamine 5'-phosphate oxidase family protein [Desulfitobacterium dichloroeliminans]AGA68277.1 putative flavin-nucleotide-binding protein [Desulfitobacterium dichloroeliminans LMG P-21439]